MKEPIAFNRHTIIDPDHHVASGIWAADAMTHCSLVATPDGREVMLLDQRPVSPDAGDLPRMAKDLYDAWCHDGERERARQSAQQSFEGFSRSGAWPAERQVVSVADPTLNSLSHNLAVAVGALKRHYGDLDPPLAFDDVRVSNPQDAYVGSESFWEDRLKALSDLLPSGSGIDSGVEIDIDASTADRIVINVPYHAMNDVGMYVGWIDYQIVVKPDLVVGIDVDVRRNGRKASDSDPHADYLGEMFADCLRQRCRMPTCLPAPTVDDAPTP